MHLKEQAKIITESTSSAKQNASLLIKHQEKLGITGQVLEMIVEINDELEKVTTAIRGPVVV